MIYLSKERKVIIMNNEELKQIIENHRHWLDEDVDGWETMCANLNGANLRDANLKGANLRFADLSDANLEGADLIEADLRDADLRGADLKGTDLKGANLESANLKGAYLKGANLNGANLRDANLRGANLSGADLRNAILLNATLSDAKNVPYIPMICPEKGSFFGYKKASDKIIKLYIPEDAKRSSATTRKCRCDRATVLAIYELDGSISNATEVPSTRDFNFIYRINKEVVVDDFDEERWRECSTGIHFFMQRQEAIDYQW